MTQQKIIVTGGAGYIGSHTVVALIEAGYEPIIVDNYSNADRNIIAQIEKIVDTSVRHYEVDCNDFSAFHRVFEKEKNVLGSIHFAASKAVGESVANPLKYYHNNIASLVNLLQLQLEFGIEHLVFSSSCTVYGEPEQLPVTENSPIQVANSPYGNTKQICEEIITDVVTSKANLKASSLRYFNPIGAHSSALIGELPFGVPNNLVPFITQTAAGLRESLTIFGDDYDTPDGTCVRDYIHVVDLAKAHVQALNWLQSQEKPNLHEAFNLGMGKGYSVLEIVQTFEKVNNLQLNYRIGEKRPGDVVRIYGSVDKANQILNWQNELSIEDALRDAWRWQLQLKEITNK
ncbi:MAG: UDP-glucose 4-epimerase GalE [Chitinophagales bacterium]